MTNNYDPDEVFPVWAHLADKDTLDLKPTTKPIVPREQTLAEWRGRFEDDAP
jgi:hypothetical protein